MAADGAEAMAWWHATQRAVADRVEACGHGTLVRSAEFPTYHDYNLLRVGESDADAATLAAEADRALEGLDHRKVEVDDEATGRRLRPAFETLGWRAARIAWLARLGPPSAGHVTGVEVDEAQRSDILALRRAWTEHWSPEQVAAFLPVEARVVALLGARLVAARRDGEPIGFVQWRARDAVAEVMLAYVTPAERGSGVGAAMIAGALARAGAAGARRFLIAADDEREAKRLYERLGFRTVWVMHEFTLDTPGVV